MHRARIPYNHCERCHVHKAYEDNWGYLPFNCANQGQTQTNKLLQFNLITQWSVEQRGNTNTFEITDKHWITFCDNMSICLNHMSMMMPRQHMLKSWKTRFDTHIISNSTFISEYETPWSLWRWRSRIENISDGISHIIAHFNRYQCRIVEVRICTMV